MRVRRRLRAVVNGGLPEAGCPVDLAAVAEAPDYGPFDWWSSEWVLARDAAPLPTLAIERAHLSGEGPDALMGGSEGVITKVDSLRHSAGWPSTGTTTACWHKSRPTGSSASAATSH